MWPPREPQTQDTRGCRLWTLLQKPRTPLGRHLWAPRGLLSVRLLCLVMWVGQTQGHMKSDMKPPRKTDGDMEEETKAGEAGLLPGQDPVSSWGAVPSCYSEHPRGCLCAGLGPQVGTLVGRRAPGM